MKLTDADRRTMKRALHAAIELEDALADAYHVGYNKRNPAAPRIVQPEHRAIVARCKRRVAAYRKLLNKLDDIGEANQ